MDISSLPNGREFLPGIFRSASVDGYSSIEFAVVVDLRNEPGPHCTSHVPLEVGLDGHPVFEKLKRETGLATPAYYKPFCELWPDRVFEAVRITETSARPVLVHCAAGWDRTGMIASILLARANYEQTVIVSDYEQSRLNATKNERYKRDEMGEWKEPFLNWLESDIFAEIVARSY